jgi:thiosulfate/3-mercaptopyruvate sulfurtransferase
MRAARIAWMLQYAGMKNVSMLLGGFRAWLRAQYPVQSGPSRPQPKTFHFRPYENILATAASIASTANLSRIVLDVRSQGEFEGSENRDCCPRPGRIPGAVWLEWTRFLDGSSSFLNGRSIMSQLRNVGVDPGKEIITYCHRGARAASAYYALKALGFPKVKNYVGSWHEWSSETWLPVETGRPTKK